MYIGKPFRLFFLVCCVLMKWGAVAQKIDIDKKPVVTNLLALPQKDIDTALHTFSYQLKGVNNLSAGGLSEQAVRDAYCKLEGYRLVETGGDLQLEISMLPFRVLTADIQSRTDKTKDKAGRETSVTKYWYVMSYETGMNWKMTDKKGKWLADNLNALQNTTIQKKNGSEYSSYKEASDSYNLNRAQISRDLAAQHMTDALSSMYAMINRQFGYRNTAEKFNIWVLDTDKHPEYAAFNEHYGTVKMVFQSIAASGLMPADREALQPAIAYYSSIPEKYKSDEKGDKKLRYAAYFNLSNIHLFLDEPDKAIEYANALVKNDYDKGDGKDFLKDAERLQELFVKKSVTSRRFVR